MLSIQLFIENQQVDLYDDESVTLTQSIQDVKNLEKVFSDFTRTFSVPASKTNNKIFQHFYNYHIIGFDARKKKQAQLYLNNEPFKIGKIKLEGVSKKNNRPHTYRITFFGNGVNLKDIIGEDKLDVLDLLKEDAFSFNYSDANVKTYMSNGLDITARGVTYIDAILFPLISHTKRLVYNSGDSSANTETQNNIAYENGTQHGLQLSQLKPALRLYPIIKAIEAQYPLINFSTDFFNIDNEPFFNLYLWLHNKTGGLFADEGNESPIGNFGNINAKGAVINLGDNSFTTPQADQLASGSARGKKQRYLDVTIEPSVSDKFTFIIYNNGSVFEKYGDVQRDSNGNYKITHLEIDAGTYSFAIDSATPSTYVVKMQVKINNSNKAYFEGSASVLSNVQLRTFNQLPDIKVIDLLTSIYKMFNLTSFQNDNGIIEVKTLDNFYENSTKIWNITEFVDKNESSTDSALPFKQVDLTYEGLNNFFAKNHNELFNQKWGELQYQSSEKFEGQIYKIKIPLEHFKYERFIDVTGSVTKDLQWGWSADIKQGAFLGKPLLFYPILKTETFGVINTDGSLSSQPSVFIPSNSVRTTDSKNLNFNAEPNEFQGSPFKQTLFNEYYKNYIKEIFDPQRRLTTIKAYLPLSLLLNYTLADKIQVFTGLYKINKVTTNFETLQSTLELINIKSQAGDLIINEPIIPDKFKPNSVCVTADDIITGADNYIITVDGSCNNEGLEIISTDEVIPNDIDTGNNPQVDDHSQPIPVTNATITINDTVTKSTNTMILKATVDELGTLGNVKQLDEYGFFWSTSQADMLIDDITILRGISSVNEIKFTTTALNERVNPRTVNAGITGLSASQTIYYRFYVFTNTDTNYTIKSVLSKMHSETTLST
jgi:hypothetical protein